MIDIQELPDLIIVFDRGTGKVIAYTKEAGLPFLIVQRFSRGQFGGTFKHRNL